MTASESGEHIAVVGDCSRMRIAVARYFARMNYTVTSHAADLAVADLLAGPPCHLVIISLVLPQHRDARALLEEIRRVSTVPVIVLAADDGGDDPIGLLERGADDYVRFVRKPFLLRELLARARNVLRHTSHRIAPAQPRTIQFGDLTIDLGLGKARGGDGRALELAPVEFRLLASLVQHADTVLSRDQLTAMVTDREWSYTDRSIDVHVGRLRRKLAATARVSSCEIHTVRGAGYMLRGAVSDEPIAPPGY